MTYAKESVNIGRVYVTYRQVKKHGKLYWTIADDRTGKRRQLSAPDEATARERALEVARDLVHGRQAAKGLSSDEARELAEARKLLDNFNHASCTRAVGCRV